MTLNRGPRRPAPAAFTLVELLVVIVIIALLASISVPAVTIAIRKAQDAAVNVEIKNLAGAIEAYKNEYGQYPPDNTAEMSDHWSRVFPRRAANDLDELRPSPPWKFVKPNGQPAQIVDLDYAEMLWFFLSGYSPDPQYPLTAPGDRTPLFTFDEGRLTDIDEDGFKEYMPKYSQGIPYVYFDGSRGVYAGKYYQVGGAADENVARPYGSSVVPGNFVNEGRFQLIAAGQDNSYGHWPAAAKLYPAGAGYSPEDLDNLTNFSVGLLGDAIE